MNHTAFKQRPKWPERSFSNNGWCLRFGSVRPWRTGTPPPRPHVSTVVCVQFASTPAVGLSSQTFSQCSQLSGHVWILPVKIGKFLGQRSLVDCCLWGHTESDTTEVTEQQQQPGFCLVFTGSSEHASHRELREECIRETLRRWSWLQQFFTPSTSKDCLSV